MKPNISSIDIKIQIAFALNLPPHFDPIRILTKQGFTISAVGCCSCPLPRVDSPRDCRCHSQPAFYPRGRHSDQPAYSCSSWWCCQEACRPRECLCCAATRKPTSSRPYSRRCCCFEREPVVMTWINFISGLRTLQWQCEIYKHWNKKLEKNTLWFGNF